LNRQPTSPPPPVSEVPERLERYANRLRDVDQLIGVSGVVTFSADHTESQAGAESRGMRGAEAAPRQDSHLADDFRVWNSKKARVASALADVTTRAN